MSFSDSFFNLFHFKKNRMKILLVGEYSRLHNSLKEGLTALGHEVILISTGDYFKKFPSDILLKPKYVSGFSKKIKVGLYKLFGFDITSLNIEKQFFSHADRLKGFDVVQLINESPFSIDALIELKIIAFLKENNKKLFLLSCGADYSSIRYAFDKKFEYSILSPLFEKKVPEKEYYFALKYLKPEYKHLHDFIFREMDGVLASDMDYHLPLQNEKKYLGLLPNPINISKLEYLPLSISGKIRIFHGINRANFFKKGNDYFETALRKIVGKYPSKVEVITVENLPYSEYIEKYNSAHILLDQALSYDQGYNALEAMAKGKVVFTGAEKEFLDFYGLKEDEVCINALPNVEKIVEKLEELILNPRKIEQISKNARAFIEREHNYISVAQKYLEKWKSAIL